jgi:ubiquitin-protein ligase
MSACSSEYDYTSDNEYDYDYDSDGDNFDAASESDNRYTDSAKPLEPLRDTIDIDTIQYQWVSLCYRLSDTYPLECDYNKLQLSISFTANNRSLILTVDNTTDQSKWYPNVPPHVSLSGDPMITNDYLLIICNSIMSKASWNICTDINWFVHKCLSVMQNTLAIKFSPLEDAIIQAAQLNGSTFAFGSSNCELPSIGVIISSSSNATCAHNSYNWDGDDKGDHSIMNALSPHLNMIASNLDKIMPYHEEIIVPIVHHLMNAGISKLEAITYESAYKSIIAIVKRLSLDIDLDAIESIINVDTVSIVDDKIIFVDAFIEHTNRIQQPKINSKFVKRIFAELDSLRDALRDFDGYLMVSEENVQQMKLLLIPDYDTPYGGGYFEFDMFIPNDYPNSPPKMKFLTTDGGSMRFNPNLYNCGKVCLSILGTWAKNQWSPSSSTLSQVVLSVFSMIFVEHPYTNEPCFYNALATPEGTAKSKQYSDNIRVKCAKIAITDQLANQLTPFRNIIQNHWMTHKGRTIAEYAKYDIVITFD